MSSIVITLLELELKVLSVSTQVRYGRYLETLRFGERLGERDRDLDLRLSFLSFLSFLRFLSFSFFSFFRRSSSSFFVIS